MTGRVFLYVFPSFQEGRDGGLFFNCYLYHDDPPTESQLNRRPVIFRQELFGHWRKMAIKELAEEFYRRWKAGTLPADNMVARR
jgi:hypothetical protein